MSWVADGVLFDLDGTLVDRDRAFMAWARSFVRDRLSLAGRAAEEAFALLGDLDAGGYGPKQAMFRQIKACHPNLTDEVDALVAAFREGLVAHLALDDDVSQVLDVLDRAGLPWGIVTNGSSNQLRKIRALGLEAGAACVVVSEIVGVRKPAPEIFRLAAIHLDVEPRTVLFAGDNPEADIVGAAGAGMRTVWLRRGRTWPTHLPKNLPHHTIDTLTELRSIVGVLGDEGA